MSKFQRLDLFSKCFMSAFYCICISLSNREVESVERHNNGSSAWVQQVVNGEERRSSTMATRNTRFTVLPSHVSSQAFTGCEVLRNSCTPCPEYDDRRTVRDRQAVGHHAEAG